MIDTTKNEALKAAIAATKSVMVGTAVKKVRAIGKDPATGAMVIVLRPEGMLVQTESGWVFDPNATPDTSKSGDELAGEGFVVQVSAVPEAMKTPATVADAPKTDTQEGTMETKKELSPEAKEAKRLAKCAAEKARRDRIKQAKEAAAKPATVEVAAPIPEVVPVVEATPAPKAKAAHVAGTEDAAADRIAKAREFAAALEGQYNSAMEVVRKTVTLKAGEDILVAFGFDGVLTRGNRLMQKTGPVFADDNGAVLVPVLVWNDLKAYGEATNVPAYTPVRHYADTDFGCKEAIARGGKPAVQTPRELLDAAKKAKADARAAKKAANGTATPKTSEAGRARKDYYPEPGFTATREHDGHVYAATEVLDATGTRTAHFLLTRDGDPIGDILTGKDTFASLNAAVDTIYGSREARHGINASAWWFPVAKTDKPATPRALKVVDPAKAEARAARLLTRAMDAVNAAIYAAADRDFVADAIRGRIIAAVRDAGTPPADRTDPRD